MCPTLPQPEGVTDGVEVIVYQLCEAVHHVVGDRLQELHHTQVLAKQAQYCEACVGYYGNLGGGGKT